MRILYLTDTHFTGKNPASRLDDIQETIINKLLDVKKIVEDEKIELILHGGDMFHTPDVSNKFTGNIASILKSYGVPMYVVPGNHDIYGYNTTTIDNTKLGLLAKTGVIKILDRTSGFVIDEGGYKIGIEGQEYHANIDENVSEDFKITNLNVDFSILVTHCMLLEHKFFDGIKHTLIDNVITNADLVLAGHYHPGFKEREKDGVWFFNPGSLVRVDASTQSINSMPRCVVFDIDKTGFNYKYVYLPSAKTGKDVFSETRLAQKLYSNTLDTFHNKIKNAKLKGVAITDLIDEYVKANNEDASIAQKAKDKIAKVDSEKSIDTGFIPESNNVYITRVEIHNFQVHKKKVVDFTNGLNVIKGESNSGKTAILRAIYWVLYDKPSGSDFITTGAKRASVKVHLSNGYIIERTRNRSTSGSYNLTKPDGTIEEFKGFAHNIPVEITNAHQMPEIKVNGNVYKINVASQLDAPFLISNGPGERVSLIGALVDADRADIAKKEFQNDKRKASTEKKQLESLLAEKENEIAKYNHLDKMKSSIDLLEIAISKVESDEMRLKSIKGIYDSYVSSKNNLSFVSSRLDTINIPDTSLIEEMKSLLDKLEVLYSVSSSYDSAKSQLNGVNIQLGYMPDTSSTEEYIREYNSLLNLLEDLTRLKEEREHVQAQNFEFDHDLDMYQELVKEFNTNLELLADITALNEQYVSLSESLIRSDEEIRSKDAEIEKLLATKEERMAELKTVHQVCETCGSEIDFDKALAM